MVPSNATDTGKNRETRAGGRPWSGRASDGSESRSKIIMDSRDGISKLMLAEKEAQAIVSEAREGTKV